MTGSKSKVTSALKLCLSGVPILCTTRDTGLRRWCEDSQPNVECLESSVAMVMAEYDKRVEDSKKRERVSARR